VSVFCVCNSLSIARSRVPPPLSLPPLSLLSFSIPPPPRTRLRVLSLTLYDFVCSSSVWWIDCSVAGFGQPHRRHLNICHRERATQQQQQQGAVCNLMCLLGSSPEGISFARSESRARNGEARRSCRPPHGDWIWKKRVFGALHTQKIHLCDLGQLCNYYVAGRISASCNALQVGFCVGGRRRRRSQQKLKTSGFSDPTCDVNPTCDVAGRILKKNEN